MCSILFFATFFNLQSGLFTSESEFFLIGPDSYYNLRLCEQTMETGVFPFVDQNDPLLNYPLTDDAGRPPVYTMVAVGATALVQSCTGLDTSSALGWCMLFLPAIYGVLLVLPVYFLAKELFNKKIALISAFILPIIPLLILPAHGCTLGLFDHDSFILLLTITFLYFLVKTFKQHPNHRKYHTALSGITLGLLYLTWVSGYIFGFILIIISFILFLFFLIRDANTSYDQRTLTYITIIGYTIYYPYGVASSQVINHAIPLIATTAIILLTLALKILPIKKMTQITLALGLLVSSSLFIFLFKPYPFNGIIKTLSTGIYGSSVFQTIAEGQILSLSSMMLYLGPVLYITALIGIVLYLLNLYHDGIKTHHIVFLTFLAFVFWTTTQAGRFLNDLVPYIALFSAFTLFFIGQKVFQTPNKRKIKRYAFISFVFILVASNTFLTVHAALPYNITQENFGTQGLWSLSMTQEQHWTDAMNYLSNQDNHIEEPEQRPGVISWWDYGFFIISLGSHPSVADNFQNGIISSASFLTSQSDEEALAILTARITQEEEQSIASYQEAFEDIPKRIEETTLTLKEYYKSTSIFYDRHIKYAIVTERDLNEIYRVFPAMCDKPLETFIQTIYQDTKTGTNYTLSQLENMTYQQRLPLNLKMIEQYQPAYYNSTAYRIYHDKSPLWNQIYNKNGIVISEISEE